MNPDTLRYSVCIPVNGQWVELTGHRHEDAAREALALQLVTDPDAALWDWKTNTIIANGDA